MRLFFALLAFVLLALAASSAISFSAYASATTPLWYPRIIGDKDDEWSKAALMSIERNNLYLYIVGNKWRQPVVVKFDVTSDEVSWALAIGDRSKGDLGDWPEFRDVAVCEGKVFVAGFTSKNGAQALVTAIDASSGKVLWLRSYGASGGELKGLGIVVDPSCKEVFVVGYVKKELGASTRDAVILKINASTGALIKAVRVDFGSSDYFIDGMYINGTLYVVGMTDALDTPGKNYDIIVAKVDARTLSVERAIDVGNKGVYEVAAISNFKNSGGAIAYDGKYLYVLGQMKDVKKGKTSTLVLALEPKSLSIVWSVRIRNATNIDVEFYPDQIAVGSKLLYVAGHSWFYPGLWKEGGFVAILDKSSGTPVAFYIVHDVELQSSMGLHGIAVTTAGGIDYVAAVGDYYLSKLRIAIEDKLGQVSVSKYKVSETSASSKVYDVTSRLPVATISTNIDKLSLQSPSSGKSNYLILLFAEPGQAVSMVRTVTKTTTATQTITLTRTVVVTATITSTATYTTTATTTKTKTIVSPTTVFTTTTVIKPVTKTLSVTKTASYTTTVTLTKTVPAAAKTVTTTVTTTVTSTKPVVKPVIPAWVWGIAAVLFFVGLGIGIAIRVARK